MSTSVATITSSTGVTVDSHQISLVGLAGAICWSVLASLIIYIIGFATPGWQFIHAKDRTITVGLWDSCVCGVHEDVPHTDQGWFRATQALATIAFILHILAAVAAVNYLFFHFVRKTLSITVTIAAVFGGVVFMFLAFVIFGSKANDEPYDSNLNYSFALCIIAAIILFVAGCLAVLQMVRARRGH